MPKASQSEIPEKRGKNSVLLHYLRPQYLAKRRIYLEIQKGRVETPDIAKKTDNTVNIFISAYL